MNTLIFIFNISLFAICNVNCAKILGLFHFPSKSHYILGSSLLQELAKRGHDVTLVSCFSTEEKILNYKEIVLEGAMQFNDGKKMQDAKQNFFMSSYSMRFYHLLTGIFQWSNKMSSFVWNHDEIQNIIKRKERYDLVISTNYMSESFMGLANQLNAQYILFSTMGSYATINQAVGNPAPYSYVPNHLKTTYYTDKMTFMQRLINTVGSLVSDAVQYFVLLRNQDDILHKYLPDAPSLYDLIKTNVSLVMLNTHFSFETVRPYLPNIIQIGGFHVKKPKPLPKDLQTYMDEAKEGVIYFSLGSNLMFSKLPPKTVNIIINTLGKTQSKVLLKTKKDIPNLPPNIKFGKWLPQNEILAHPNIKLFITHCGLLSTTEALTYGVPLISIPFFSDQEANTIKAVNHGYAIKVDMKTITEEGFSNALNEVLNNKKYQNNAQKISALLRDQPMEPMDNAVWWIEYVLRHNGTPHLRNKGVDLRWYQYMLLDVIGVIIILNVLFLLAVYCIFKFCQFLLCRVKCIFSTKSNLKKD